MEKFQDELLIIPHGIGNVVTTSDELTCQVYPDLLKHYQDHEWVCERAILAPRNDAVRNINFQLLKQIPAKPKLYKSVDTVPDIDNVVDHPTELILLNTLHPSGMLPDKIELMVGAHNMLLRNLGPTPNLRNGTRLVIKQRMERVIEATIAICQFKRDDIIIPRIPLISSESPFEFKRLRSAYNLLCLLTSPKDFD